MTLARSTRRIAVALALVALAGCSARAVPPSTFARSAEAVILLTVENHDYRDATIYADWRGVKARVGMVVGKTTETFSMPWRDYDVRFVVDFVGGGGFRVPDAVSVWGGEHLDLVIMPGW